MSRLQVSTTWKEGLSFDGEARGHHFAMDVKEEAGGRNTGPTPKEMLLAGVIGCTGMDVAAILKTMRQPMESLVIHSKADTRESYPQILSSLHLIFEVKGEVKPEKLKHAVMLSQTKYCGVSAVVSATCPITYEIFLNGERIGDGQAKFDLANGEKEEE